MSEIINTEVVVDKWADYRIGNQIHLFIIGEVSILQELIPEGVQGSQVILETNEEGDPIKTRQMTVLEFISGGVNENQGHYWLSPDVNQAMIYACKMDAATYRQKSFVDKDADDWEFYKEAVWGDRAELITHARHLEILTEWFGNEKVF